MKLPFRLSLCLTILGTIVLGGCGEREQTAILVAEGSGTQLERLGKVTYTDQSGQSVETATRLLPWSIQYKVKKGQTISVAVSGRSPARNYMVQIEVGHDADDRVIVASQRGFGDQKVSCSYTVP